MASKLFVGNLSHSTTESGLSDFVTNAGFQVASAVVIRDKMTGSPRGFGFVELSEGQDMARRSIAVTATTISSEVGARRASLVHGQGTTLQRLAVQARDRPRHVLAFGQLDKAKSPRRTRHLVSNHHR